LIHSGPDIEAAPHPHSHRYLQLAQVGREPFFLTGHTQGSQEDMGAQFLQAGQDLLFLWALKEAVLRPNDAQFRPAGRKGRRGLLRHPGLGAQEKDAPAPLGSPGQQGLGQLNAGYAFRHLLPQNAAGPNHTDAIRHH